MGYMDDTASSKRRTAAIRAQSTQRRSTETPRPFITGTALTSPMRGRSAEPDRSVSHNMLAQRSSEHREATQTRTGTLQATVYDAQPRGADKKFKGIENEQGAPRLSPGVSKKGDEQRMYVSMDAPGVASPDSTDKRMNRNEVATQYRASYKSQQDKKGHDAIPATYHAEIDLRQARRVEKGAIAQHKASEHSKAERTTRDQTSDDHKYKASYGLTGSSFGTVAATTRSGTERLATASHKDRATLSQQYGPGTVVHPSSLSSPAEQMLQRQKANATSSKVPHKKG